MEYFRFDLNGHGWAAVNIFDGTDCFRCRVTNVARNDALYDTVAACIDLLSGKSYVGVSYFDEPGEHRLRLTRVGDRLEVSIIWFPDDAPFVPDSSWVHDGKDYINTADEPPFPRREQVFTAVVPADPFLQAAYDSLHHCYLAFGSVRYKKEWSPDDPTDVLQQLQSLLPSTG